MNEEQEKISFAEQIVYGMFRPSKYKQLLELKRGRFILYIIVMMAVLAIVTFAIPVAAIITGFGGFDKLITKTVPAFTYTDGSLSIEKEFSMNFSSFNVVIDTEDETVPSDELEDDGMYIAVGSKKMQAVLVSGSKQQVYYAYDLSDLLADGFNNQSMLNMVPTIYAALAITFLFQMISFMAKYCIAALFYAFVVSFLIKHINVNLNFKQLFVISFYAQSLGMIVNNFNEALSYPINFMIVGVICLLVTFNIISLAVVSFREDRQ